MTETTDHRCSLSYTTLSGGDPPTLSFAGLRGEEALGRPYEYRVRVLTEDSESPSAPTVLTDDEWESMLGGEMIITMTMDDDEIDTRYFTGFIDSVDYVGQLGNTGMSVYSVVLVPRIALLRYTRQYRIFKNKTIPEIISGLLDDNDFGSGTDYESSLNDDDYLARVMVTQYGESDFHFIHRLMELTGIAYHFKHSASGHIMTFTDTNTPLKDVSEGVSDSSDTTEIIYQNTDSWTEGYRGIWRYKSAKKLCALSVGGSYYDFTNAGNDYTATEEFKHDSEAPYSTTYTWMKENYYPLGTMSSSSDSDSATWTGSIRADAIAHQDASEFQDVDMVGNHRLLQTGYEFTLKNGPISSTDLTYQIVSMRFRVGTNEYPIPMGKRRRKRRLSGPRDAYYQAKVKVIPAETEFTPREVTEKPTIHGIQSALVVTGSSDEGKSVDTDEYGRVYVQYHWPDASDDSDTASDYKTTEPIRVTQFWAGKTRGAIFTPRVGDEVLVAFEHGDPDRPFIIGSAYNSVNEPFITPSEYPLVSGIRTKTAMTSDEDLDSDYKSINHSDLLFNDLYSDATKGVMLRAFRNSAGSDYDFEGDDDNLNLIDDCASLTIMATETEDKTMNLALNVGSDVQTLMVGNQEEWDDQLADKRIVSSVGLLTSQTWNMYQSAQYSFNVNGYALFNAVLANPLNSLQVGPYGNALNSLLGSNSIRSGVPSGSSASISTDNIYSAWTSVYADRNKAGDDDMSELANDMAAGDSTISSGLSTLFSDYTGSTTDDYKNIGEFYTRLGMARIITEETEGDNIADMTMVPTAAEVVVKDSSSSDYSKFAMASAALSEQVATSDVTSSISLGQKYLYASVDDSTTLSMGDSKVIIGADEGKTRAAFGSDKAVISVNDGSSSMMVSTSSSHLMSEDTYCLVNSDCAGFEIGDAYISVSSSELDLVCGSTIEMTSSEIAAVGSSILLNSGSGNGDAASAVASATSSSLSDADDMVEDAESMEDDGDSAISEVTDTADTDVTEALNDADELDDDEETYSVAIEVAEADID